MFLEVALLVLTQLKDIHDGDTITTDLGKVRLVEVDAPELKQPFGLESQEFVTRRLKIGSYIILDTKGKDLYKRTLGRVLLDYGTLNEELIYQGYAWAYTKKFKKLQDWSQSQKKGLWIDKDPEEPRKYRKRTK